jgi:hypothetical protein
MGRWETDNLMHPQCHGKIEEKCEQRFRIFSLKRAENLSFRKGKRGSYKRV